MVLPSFQSLFMISRDSTITVSLSPTEECVQIYQKSSRPFRLVWVIVVLLKLSMAIEVPHRLGLYDLESPIGNVGTGMSGPELESMSEKIGQVNLAILSTEERVPYNHKQQIG